MVIEMSEEHIIEEQCEYCNRKNIFVREGEYLTSITGEKIFLDLDPLKHKICEECGSELI